MIEDWEAMYRALVRRLVEIADSPSATERLMLTLHNLTFAEHAAELAIDRMKDLEWLIRDYDKVARAHERVIKDHPKDQKDSEPTFEGLPQESF